MLVQYTEDVRQTKMKGRPTKAHVLFMQHAHIRTHMARILVRVPLLRAQIARRDEVFVYRVRRVHAFSRLPQVQVSLKPDKTRKTHIGNVGRLKLLAVYDVEVQALEPRVRADDVQFFVTRAQPGSEAL